MNWINKEFITKDHNIINYYEIKMTNHSYL